MPVDASCIGEGNAVGAVDEVSLGIGWGQRFKD
jgi:hypothetical protein